MQRNMHVVGGACYVPVVLKGARTRGVYLCTLRTRHAIPADALPAAAAHGAEQLQHVHRLVWDSLLTCNCLRGVSRWFTPLACGPGSPELSKSNLDMASKLFTLHLHLHLIEWSEGGFKPEVVGPVSQWYLFSRVGRF